MKNKTQEPKQKKWQIRGENLRFIFRILCFFSTTFLYFFLLSLLPLVASTVQNFPRDQSATGWKTGRPTTNNNNNNVGP